VCAVATENKWVITNNHIITIHKKVICRTLPQYTPVTLRATGHQAFRSFRNWDAQPTHPRPQKEKTRDLKEAPLKQLIGLQEFHDKGHGVVIKPGG
jgi:hypothetical protein